MTEKDKKPLEQETESILDFEDAKEMTIGQANRKAEEIEAGVTEGDNVLDKYIKQHQAEIEAEKYSAIRSGTIPKGFVCKYSGKNQSKRQSQND